MKKEKLEIIPIIIIKQSNLLSLFYEEGREMNKKIGLFYNYKWYQFRKLFNIKSEDPGKITIIIFGMILFFDLLIKDL